MPAKKLQTKFPLARIKKIIQTDEDVGKVAAVTPYLVAKAMEAFVEDLVGQTAALAADRRTNTISAFHLKQSIQSNKQFDFLTHIVEHVPDIEPEPPKPKAKKRQRSKKTASTNPNDEYVDEGDDYEPKPKKKRRKKSTKPKPVEKPKKPMSINAVLGEDITTPEARSAPSFSPFDKAQTDSSVSDVVPGSTSTSAASSAVKSEIKSEVKSEPASNGASAPPPAAAAPPPTQATATSAAAPPLPTTGASPSLPTAPADALPQTGLSLEALLKSAQATAAGAGNDDDDDDEYD